MNLRLVPTFGTARKHHLESTVSVLVLAAISIQIGIYPDSVFESLYTHLHALPIPGGQ